MTHLLSSALAPVVQRRRNYLFLRATVWIWAILATAGVLASFYAPPDERLVWAGGIALAALFFGLHAYLWRNRWHPDYRQIARSIEQRHPELHSLLLTAVEQVPEPQSGQLNFLQARVVQAAIDESRKHQWVDEIPTYRWLLLLLLQLALLPALFYAGLRLASTGHFTPRVNVAPVVVEPVVTVTPGDAEMERGSGLIVTARFEEQVPTAAALVIQPKNGPVQRVELTRNLNDPVFGGGLPEVNGDFTYRVEYSEKATRDFQVHVFEHPRLERADATLRPPAYTHQPEKQINETRRLSGVEGSKLDVAFQLNKPVTSAWLQGKNGQKLPLTVAGDQPVAQLKDFTLAKSQAYELHLADADGRENKMPESFAIDVLPNRRPELKRKLPQGDQRVSPLQEVAFDATAWDDFGLVNWGLSLTLPNGEAKEISLGTETPPDKRIEGRHLLKLEGLNVSPDDLISWHLWAEDIGPDGQKRRTTGDIYFAEVRPFEEIYRAGEQQPGGSSEKQQGMAQEVTKLAELQKQIIAATWNLQRRDQGPSGEGKKKAAPDFEKDLPVIRDNQSGAAEQAEALRDKLEDPKAKTFAEEAMRDMRTAVERLTKAQPAPPLLPEALPPEQKAYADLLKLAAHEYEVSKSQKGSGSESKQNGQKQEMLDQLELKQEENRYETKSEATEQNKQQQEQLAILNRLKELAQRQQDINERIKELQTALQEAKTEAEREEAKRQLKRLQEEQQQMLADMDELKQSMEKATNQSELAQERNRLEQTRQDAQKASEAMRQEKATEALAAGKRSEQELQKLRDDFRDKSSARFRDQMREMRRDARQLAQNQEEIGQKLQEATKEKESTLKSLDAQDPREQLGQQLAEQQTGLDKLQKEMRDVSEQAEVAEPLLSRQLYDSLRKSAQAGTDETLKKAGALANRGYTAQAKPFEEKARKEVGELKDGVEKAAEAVLGNEAESLKQARSELEKLAAEINREIARARPDLADNGKKKYGRKEGRGEAEKGEQAGGEKAQQDGKGQQPGDPNRPGKGKQAKADGRQPGEKGERGEKGEKGEMAQNGKGKQPGDKPGDEAEAGRGEKPGQKGEGEKGENGKGQMAQNQKGEQAGKGQQEGEGKQPGEGKGQAQSEGKQPGEEQGQRGQKGQMAGQGKGKGQQGEQGEQPGEGKGQGQQGQKGQTAQNGKGQGQQGQQPGEGEQAGQGQQGGAQGQGQNRSGDGQNRTAQNGNDQAGKPGSRLRDLAMGPMQRSGIRSGGGGGGDWRGGRVDDVEGPLTGEDFAKFSDRLRNVEEMIDNREIREQVTQVREEARTMRFEYKRHSKEPQWDMVKMKIGQPLAELRDRVAEELARRDSKESLVPIDRDPVPPKYAERVRRYYEGLGK